MEHPRARGGTDSHAHEKYVAQGASASVGWIIGGRSAPPKRNDDRPENGIGPIPTNPILTPDLWQFQVKIGP